MRINNIVLGVCFLAWTVALEADGRSQTQYEYFAKISETEKAARHSRNQQIKWIGEFKETEKQELINFFDDTDKELDIYSSTQVVKTDLDSDGRPEYVANLLFESQKPFHYGESLCFVSRNGNTFEVSIIGDPITDPGLRAMRRIQAIDIDGDGFKEVVDQRVYHISGDEEASILAVIFKNRGMTFRNVYRRYVYDYLTFEDLDDDGRVEIMESINEFKLVRGGASNWINIYNWSGATLDRTSSKYPDFYMQKEEEYKKILSDSIAIMKQYRKKTGRNNPIYDDIINAMNSYLERIELMRKRKGEEIW